MPRYEKAAPEVLAMLLSVASEQYPDLAQVRFDDVVMAWSSSDLPAAEARRTLDWPTPALPAGPTGASLMSGTLIVPSRQACQSGRGDSCEFWRTK